MKKKEKLKDPINLTILNKGSMQQIVARMSAIKNPVRNNVIGTPLDETNDNSLGSEGLAPTMNSWNCIVDSCEQLRNDNGSCGDYNVY